MVVENNKTIIFTVNVDWFFISHRLPIALKAIDLGWTVYLFTKDTGHFGELEKRKIRCIEVKFERSGRNIFKDLLLIYKLKKLYKKIQPEIIHQITLKPSIYGTIALKGFKNRPRVVNAVSGLGYSFTDKRKGINSFLLLFLLKKAFADKQSNFIFQNPDDRDFYQSLGFLTKNNYVIIKGSGVDEVDFSYREPCKKQKLNVTLLSRMLYDKGIIEFILAAESLKSEFFNKVEFILVGGIDLENPAHITEKDLLSKCDGNYITWVGHKTNIREIYEQADIVCLPSYREGFPKSLVEAMAIGRPIVTTDTPGCRECVTDGVNGFLVPIKNHELLADKLKILLENSDLRIIMGKASREKMEVEMSLKKVINLTFDFYDRIS